MLKLSISIVAYRNYSEIEDNIKSIEKYTSNDKKIYIIDNSELEDLDKIKKEFIKRLNKYKDVEYIDTKQNLGFGKGHNFIINKLESEYHAIVNPDVLLKDDAFKNILDYLEKNKDVGMVIPNIVSENGERQKVYRLEPTMFDMFIRMFCKGLFKKRKAKHTMQDMDYSKPFQVPFGQGSFLVIRTNLFKKLNGFDDRYFMYMEDADLCKRVNMESKLMYIPNATIIHKWKRESHKNIKLLRIHIESMFKYFRKWKCEK